MTDTDDFLDEVHSRFELPNAVPRYPRDADFRISNLSLHLEVDTGEKSIRGRAVYALRGIEGRRPELVSLDARELKIESVTCNGRNVDFTHVDDRLNVAPEGSVDSLELEIVYSGRPESGLFFISPDADSPGKPVQVWSQGEDEFSKYWFPCFDAPNLKFPTDFHITAKAGLFALSNGRLTGTSEDSNNGTTTFHWKEEVPHSSYLNSIAVGDFAAIEETYRGIPLQYYVQKGREEEAKRSFGKTSDMMKFFEGIIGVNYPYEKYAQVAVSDFIWGGMENVSATTLTDETLHDARAENDFPSHGLVAHELAHQWWGDLVTTKDWSNIWLNEGFATYFEAQYRQHDRGEDEFEYYLDSLARAYFAEDSKSYRRPIVQRSYLVPTELFDRTTYQKGALVLHMIRMELGDDLFRRSMNSYCTENRTGNVETSDLIKAIEQTTGRNMQSFFDQWVYSAGYPELRVRYSYKGKRREIELDIDQTQKTDQLTPLFAIRLPVSLHFTGGKRRDETIQVDSAKTAFTLQLPEKPLFVSIDPHNTVLKKVEYERPWEDVASQLEHGTPFEKIQAARELAKSARRDTVISLGRELSRKNFWGVHAECAEALGKLNRRDALDALLSAEIPDSRARKVLVKAIGSYREGALSGKLEQFLGDESYAVQAEAVTALSQLEGYDSSGVLGRALGMHSHQDVVLQAALAGYGERGKVEDTDRLKAYTSRKYRNRVRSAAIKAIARIGREDSRTRRFIYGQLHDKSIVYRRGVIEACVITENGEAIGELQALIDKERGGRLKRDAFDAIATIRKNITRPSEIGRLEKEMDELRGDLRSLRHAVESLEKRIARKR